jgi:hypothetical protein
VGRLRQDKKVQLTDVMIESKFQQFCAKKNSRTIIAIERTDRERNGKCNLLNPKALSETGINKAGS